MRASRIMALAATPMVLAALTGHPAPAHATLGGNALTPNGLELNGFQINGLQVNAIGSNGLATTGSAVDDLDGVQVEAVTLPATAQ